MSNGKNQFEDEYAQFVTDVKNLFGDNNLKKYHYPIVQEPTKENVKQSYFEECIKYTDYSIEQHWRSGGIGGGSCWGDDTHYELDSDTAPTTFKELITILGHFWSEITFLQYQKFIPSLINQVEYTENEYYGNSTTYTYQIVSLRDLFVLFNENGILPK